MTLLKKFCRLESSDRRLLLEALALLWAIRFGLRWIGFRSVGDWLRRLRRSRPETPQRIRWALNAAGRTLPRSGHCLTVALAEQTLLRMSGHSAELKWGVQRGAGRFRAHAWITPDPNSAEFVPMNGSV